MSHSMLNRKVLSAQARAIAHPYGRQQHQPSAPEAPGPPHPPPASALATAAAPGRGPGPVDDAPRPPPATAPPGAIPSYSYTAAALDQLTHQDMATTPYSTQSYPTVPLQTAKQRARSVKVAATARAASAATAAAAAEVASAAAARVAALTPADADDGHDQRRRSTVSLEEMLSGDEEGGAGNPMALPYPSSFFDLDALSMASTSALMAETQFLAGNPAPPGPRPMAPPPPPTLSASVCGMSAGPSGGARSTASSTPSAARPGPPSTATHDHTLTSKSSSSASSSSASVADSMYTDSQYQHPTTGRHAPAFRSHHQQQHQQRIPKRPPPPVSSTQAQQLHSTAFPTSLPADQTTYPAPPTHDTSTLGSGSFYRLPTSSELNLTAAAQSYQAQRAAYEYMPTSTTVSGVNAEDVLSVPFLPEISYLTNPEGDIVSVEDAAWNAFMDKNNAHPFLPQVARCCFPQVMGRSLFEFLRDPKLARFTRHLLHMVSTGSQPRLTYHWFCDSPTVERKMVMSVSRLTGLNNQPVVLWSSKILWERDLPVPASYLALPATNQDPKASGAMPCCSYCKRVMVYLSDLTLTPELVASLMAGSPQGSPTLLNKSDARGGAGGDPGDAVAETRGDEPPGDLPDYEPNGLVPIFGLRGKRGVQEKPPFSAGTTHVWLTPTQYSLARVSAPVSHVYHGVCEVCWGELVRFFGI